MSSPRKKANGHDAAVAEERLAGIVPSLCLLPSPSLAEARNYLLIVVVIGDIMARPKRSISWVNCHLPAY